MTESKGLHYEIVKFDEVALNGEHYFQILIEDELYTGWLKK